MNDDQTPAEDRLDKTLREKFEQYDLTPGAPVWRGVEQRVEDLRPPGLPRRRKRWWPLPLLFLLTGLVAGLGGWLLPHSAGPAVSQVANTVLVDGATKSTATTSQQLTGSRTTTTDLQQRLGTTATPTEANSHALASSAAATAGFRHHRTGSAAVTEGFRRRRGFVVLAAGPDQRRKAQVAIPMIAAWKQQQSALTTVGRKLGDTGRPAGAVAALPLLSSSTTRKSTALTSAQVADSSNAALVADHLPLVLRPLVLLERTTTNPLLTKDGRRATLLAEKAELTRLQRRADSLLLALNDNPPPARLAQMKMDSALLHPAAHRWSLLITAAPEQNYLKLEASSNDELTTLRRNQETGRVGFSAAVQAEYQATKRVSFGAGLGFSTYGAELRQAVRSTGYKVTYDSTTTHTNIDYTTTSSTYSIRIIQIAQLNPVFNSNGQVLRYDTVYVPRNDTLRSTIVSHDVVNSSTTTKTPLLQATTTTTYKTYRPDYRFLTLPLSVRYHLLLAPGSRWWTDVSAGAQLQFFLGGSQLVTEDGQNFHTETVRIGEGPFRPFNLALSGALALNYALTERLSVSVAPSLRWQPLSVFKPETGLRQQPTATGLQFGVRFKL